MPRERGPDVLVHDNGGSLVGHDCEWRCCAPRVSISVLLRSFWRSGRGKGEGDGIVVAGENAVDEGVNQCSRAVMRSVALAPAECQAPDEYCGVRNVAWLAGSLQRHAVNFSCIKPQNVDLILHLTCRGGLLFSFQLNIIKNHDDQAWDPKPHLADLRSNYSCISLRPANFLTNCAWPENTRVVWLIARSPVCLFFFLFFFHKKACKIG